MTKKFWYNWQKRANATDIIWLHVKRSDGTPYQGYATRIDGKIQSVKFNGDKVTIATENACRIWDPMEHCWTKEMHTHIFNRTDIKTVYFM